MTLLVLHQRPVVGAVFQHVILHDLILGGVVGILADAPRKLGVIRVDTRVDDRHRDPRPHGSVPDVAHVEVVQIGLTVVVGVAHGVLRTGGEMLASRSLPVARQKIADLGLVVQRHIFYVLTVLTILVDIEYRDPLGKGQRREASVLGDTELRAKGLGQFFRPRLRGIRQHDALRIVPSLVIVQLLQSLVLLHLQLGFALMQHQHGNCPRNETCHQYADEDHP